MALLGHFVFLQPQQILRRKVSAYAFPSLIGGLGYHLTLSDCQLYASSPTSILRTCRVCWPYLRLSSCLLHYINAIAMLPIYLCHAIKRFPFLQTLGSCTVHNSSSFGSRANFLNSFFLSRLIHPTFPKTLNKASCRTISTSPTSPAMTKNSKSAAGIITRT